MIISLKRRLLAEREGFEPSKDFSPYSLSRGQEYIKNPYFTRLSEQVHSFRNRLYAFMYGYRIYLYRTKTAQ